VSQFGTDGPESRLYRERGYPTRPLVQTGIDVRLDPAGEAAFSPGAKAADEFAQAMGLGANILAGLAERQQIERVQEEARDREFKELWESQADRDFQKWAPGVLQRIQDRTLVAGDDIAASADTEITAAVTGDDFPKDYRTRFRDRATALLTPALTAQKSAIAAEARDQNLAVLSGGLDAPDITPARAMQVLATGRKIAPGLSDAEFYGKTLMPAIGRAADRGDAAVLDSLLNILPAEYATERQAAVLRATTVSAANKRKDEDAAANEVFGALNAVRNNQGSYTAARERIGAMLKDGRIDEQTAFRLHETVDSQESGDRAKNEKVADEAAYQTQFATYRDFAREHMLDGANTGGAARLPKKFTVVFPSGRASKEIDRDELVNAVVDEHFQRIDSETQGNPAANLNRKIDFISRQGGEAVYEPWKATLNGVVSQAVRADVGDAVPPVAVQAVQLYDHLQKNEAVGVLESHLTDEESRNFLRTVSLFQKHQRGVFGTNPGGPTIEQAIRNASKVSAGRAFSKSFNRSADPSLVDKRAESLAGSMRAGNVEDIRQMLADKAEMYKVMGGVDDETALAQATSDIREDFRTIDGVAVFSRGRRIPHNLESELAPLLKSMYVDDFGKREGVDADLIRLKVDPRSGMVTLSDRVGNKLPDAPAYAIAELADFNVWRQGIADADERERLGAGRRNMTETVGRHVNRAILFGLGRDLPIGRVATPAELATLEQSKANARKIPEGTSPELAAMMKKWLGDEAEISRKAAEGAEIMSREIASPPISVGARENY
jgi:hypothetical protein